MSFLCEQTPDECRAHRMSECWATMGAMNPELELWPAAPLTLDERVLCHASDRVAWMRARSRGVTATDAARLSGPRAVAQVCREKVMGPRFTGNAYTEHGKLREPQIAKWVSEHFGIAPSNALYRSAEQARHLATPDGVGERGVVLAEIKTTTKDLSDIPRNYLRQIWWQQYVIGAERTLFVWEQHREFVPVDRPQWQWVERDDREIAKLVGLADEVLAALP